MKINDLLAYRKPHPGARILVSAVQTLKGFKYPIQVFFIKAYPVIFNKDPAEEPAVGNSSIQRCFVTLFAVDLDHRRPFLTVAPAYSIAPRMR